MEADEQLARQAQGGDPEAFRQLVHQHSHALFRLAYRLTGNAATAEDVVQETFLKAHRHLARFDGRARFSTWLYRIAVNTASDHRRSRSRQEDRWDALADSEAGGFEPRSGARMPSRHSIVVVLPAPLGPTRPKISPRRTSNDTSSTATTAP